MKEEKAFSMVWFVKCCWGHVGWSTLCVWCRFEGVTANSCQSISSCSWSTGSQHFHLLFIGGGMAGVGDYACLWIYAIFLAGKVVVSMFTHAASDLIRACSPFTGFTSESMLRFTDQQIACPDCRFVCGCGLICTYTTGTGLGDWHCISISFGMHWSKSPATPTFPHLSPGPSIGLLFTLLFWDRNSPPIYQFHWCLTSLLPLCKWHCCPVGDHQLCYFPFCSICPSVDETQVGFLLILLHYFGVCMSWSWRWPIQVLSHLNQL